ncbi:hypothetical protein HOO54_04040 [Bacillus sp. WMMC1349]|uniref:YfaP family protein n=1 Tax=Bacillus sp. WMMC1349 TaxID=2736254 RepID=UPI00155444EF|nr:hypothetical protein [Bacillus sp. WMMC1349]NPC91435.1 hypothetical protein [Bacillus sp. WMMC1349]
MTNYIYTTEDSKRDGSLQFKQDINIFFTKSIAGSKKLFKTDVKNLYDLYLANIPVEARQHYTCSECRRFINRYGHLVTIDDTGRTHSVIWDVDHTPTFFIPAVKAMKEAVINARVNGVFLPDEKRLGTPRTGQWTHLALELPREMTNRSMLKNAHQAMAEKKQQFETLTTAFISYSTDTVDKALTFIHSGTLYRGERVRPMAEWFKQSIEKVEAIQSSHRREALIWLLAATAPEGFTSVRSSVLGSLLNDIEDGLSTDLIARRFKEKMDPAHYMRSQQGPSASAILEAERVVEKLGISESLKRRYALYEEIPSFLWQNRGFSKTPQSAGVFGHITPELKQPAHKMTVPNTVMTWEKFKRTVLPTVQNIEALVDHPSRLMALVTAADDHAPHILSWENTFSWYYHGGIDGEIRRRVEEAGGRYENNEIRASLIWEGYTDLDIHCITPYGEHIYYGSKNGRCGGYLDIDMNGGDHRNSAPVENIRWTSNAPEGRYRFFVENYAERGNGSTPYKVELEINGKIYTHIGTAGNTGYRSHPDVFDFVYKKGQQPVIQHISSNDSWSVETNSFVKVRGITTSPNLWGENPVYAIGQHIFFLLEGVKDLSEGKGRGFFNETLKADLRPIRRTLEAYTAQTPIANADKASACGIGYSMDHPWDLTLRVTDKLSTRFIKIDRWD